MDASSYLSNKNAKRNFRKRHRQASKQWHMSIFDELEKAAEMNIGTFYETAWKKISRSSVKLLSRLVYHIRPQTTIQTCATRGNIITQILQKNTKNQQNSMNRLNGISTNTFSTLMTSLKQHIPKFQYYLKKFSDRLTHYPKEKLQCLIFLRTNILSLVVVNLWKNCVFCSIPYLDMQMFPKCSKW